MYDTAMINAQSEDLATHTAIVRSIGDAVVTIDARGTVGSLNPAAERLFGMSDEEANGLPFSTVRLRMVKYVTVAP